MELIILVEPGSKSVERQIQLERERYVLQTIYFSKETVPTSAEEPEKEEFEAKLAIEIPLEDVCLLPPFPQIPGYFLSIYLERMLFKINSSFLLIVSKWD